MRNGQSSYEFDPIGNREYTDEAGTVRHWQANELNQYTAISNGTTQTPAYDSDGNLIFYNGWTYAWNAENRLIRATNSLYEIEYAYDHMGRMVAKTRDGITTTYLWDDYNIIYEHRLHLTSYNVWGLDLSGAMQGAGGVGGLLGTVVRNTIEPSTNTYFACFDANGNVSEYVSELGHIAAHREFDAFGNTISSYGPHRNSLTHWWSTKPWDHITGLSEYEYRKYSPELGRWLKRDSVEDIAFGVREASAIKWRPSPAEYPILRYPNKACINENCITSFQLKGIDNNSATLALYAVVKNNPIDEYDYLGLQSSGTISSRGGVMCNEDCEKVITGCDLGDSVLNTCCRAHELVHIGQVGINNPNWCTKTPDGCCPDAGDTLRPEDAGGDGGELECQAWKSYKGCINAYAPDPSQPPYVGEINKANLLIFMICP